MALIARSYQDRPNSDFSLDPRFPLGDKPAVVSASLGINTTAFAAAAIDLLNRPAGTAISINYRTFLTGTSAATATLSVFAVSGALGNWGIDVLGNSLTNPAFAAAGPIQFQVRATDGVNTVSFPTQNASIVAQVVGAQKWVPGWSMELDQGSGGGGLSGWVSQIAAIANEPNIKSVTLLDNWSKFEDPAGGTYANGFNVVDQLLAACAAAGKKLFLGILPQLYASSPPSTAAGVLPTYFETLHASDGLAPAYVKWPGGTPWAGSLALSAMLWDSVVMDKFIALTTAYAARYEGDSTFAMFMNPGETASGVPVGTRGYSVAGRLAQEKRWMPAARAVFSTTMLRMQANYLGSNAVMQDLVDSAFASKVTVGGPDIAVNKSVQANIIFNGSAGTQDYRVKSAFISELQSSDYQRVSNPSPTTSLPTIFTYEGSGLLSQGGSMQAPIFIVKRNTWGGPTGNYPLWTQNILPFIRANPITRTAYPTGW